MASTFIPPVLIQLMADIRDFQAKQKQVISGLKDVEKQGASTSERMKFLGSKVATGVIMGGLAVGVATTKMAADFQEKMTLLVTGAGEAEANIKMIHDGILSLAGEVGQAPKDLADGMYLIASAGFHGAEALNILKASAQGAKVGGADLATVANAVTTVMTNWGMKSDQAAQATSALIRTVSLGKTNMNDLGGAMSKVAPVGAKLGLSLADVGAAMAAMTASGVSADMASEGLRAMFLGMVTPTQTALQELKWMGLTAEDVVQSMKDPRRGLIPTLKMIQDHLGKKVPEGSQAYIQAMNDLMGGQTGYAASLFITGKGLKTVEANQKALNDAQKGGQTVLGWDKVKKNLNTQLDQFQSSLQSIAINVGEWFLPKAQKAIAWANHIIEWFKKHPLAGKIASDAAIGAFGIAVTSKIVKGLLAVKNIFSGGLMTKWIARNVTALDRNTRALIKAHGLKESDIFKRAAGAGVVAAKVISKIGVGGASLLAEGLGTGLAVTAAEALPLPGSTTSGLTMKKLKQVYSGGPKAVAKFLKLIGGEKNLKDYVIGDDNQTITAASIKRMHNGIESISSDTGGRFMGINRATVKNNKIVSTKFVTIKVVN